MNRSDHVQTNSILKKLFVLKNIRFCFVFRMLYESPPSTVVIFEINFSSSSISSSRPAPIIFLSGTGVVIETAVYTGIAEKTKYAYIILKIGL